MGTRHRWPSPTEGREKEWKRTGGRGRRKTVHAGDDLWERAVEFMTLIMRRYETDTQDLIGRKDNY